MGEVFGRTRPQPLHNDMGSHLSPSAGLSSFGRLHRTTLVDREPPMEFVPGMMVPANVERGDTQRENTAEGGIFGAAPALSRVFKMASETCKSVYNMWSPKKEPKEDKTERIAVPKLNLDGKPASQGSRKRKAVNVLELARRASRSKTAVAELEEGFNSKTSVATKKAMRATIGKILKEARGEPPVPPTAEKLKVLAGVLKQANYRAAPQYLGEFKIMAIEGGHQWSDQLERTLKLCKRSTTRALGPKKKAKEVPVQETGKTFVPTVTRKKPKTVPLARELLEFGVIWMLREIELALLTKDHLKVDVESRSVVLTIPVSKTDQTGLVMTRMLQCLCESKDCSTGCPLRVSALLVFGMEDLKTHHAAVTNKGKKAKKSQVVKEWQKLYGKGTSGHSTRRTGALRYIRHGWAIPQVAYLGRWKSDVIYEYAAEALESLPVNANRAFITNLYGTKEHNEMGPINYKPRDVEEVRDYLLSELSLAQEHQQRALKAMDFEIESMKKRADRNNGRLPPFVRLLDSRIVHHNWNMTACTPPLAWKTMCGWHYHKSDYMFLASEEGGQVCKKCMEIAQLQKRV